MTQIAPRFSAEWRSGGGSVVLASLVGVSLGLSGLPFYTLGVLAPRW